MGPRTNSVTSSLSIWIIGGLLSIIGVLLGLGYSALISSLDDIQDDVQELRVSVNRNVQAINRGNLIDSLVLTELQVYRGRLNPLLRDSL